MRCACSPLTFVALSHRPPNRTRCTNFLRSSDRKATKGKPRLRPAPPMHKSTRRPLCRFAATKPSRTRLSPSISPRDQSQHGTGRHRCDMQSAPLSLQSGRYAAATGPCVATGSTRDAATRNRAAAVVLLLLPRGGGPPSNPRALACLVSRESELAFLLRSLIKRSPPPPPPEEPGDQFVF